MSDSIELSSDSLPLTVIDHSLTEPTVELVPIDSLLHDDNNPNVGTSRTNPLLDYSLAEHGFLESGTIDRDRQLVGGNKRIEAAKRAGYKYAAIIRLPPDTAAVIQDPSLDLDSPDPDVRARSRRAGYTLNFSAQQSIKIDAGVLKQDIKDGLDLSRLMTKRDITKLGVQLDEPDDLEQDYEPPASPEEAQAEFHVKVGDVWKLGRHTLSCQDATFPTLPLASEALIPQLVVTSPPYGVGKEYESSDMEDWRQLIEKTFENIRNHQINTVAINLGDKHTGNDGWERHTFGELIAIMGGLGYSHLNTRVWVKQPAWSQTPYWRTTFKTVDEFEYIGLFAMEKPKYTPRLTDEENNEWGYRSVWEMTSVSRNDIHSAMFPLELPLRLIRLHTDQGDTVFEPFSGSGTTIIACEASRRTCVATELLPEYCAVSLKRFYDVTNIEPIREKEGY